MIGGSVFICLSVVITIITMIMSSTLEKKAFEVAIETSKNCGNEVRADLEVALDTTRALSQAFEGMKYAGNENREAANSILKTILENNQDFLAVWSIWDENAFDNRDKDFIYTDGHDKTGRFNPYFYRKDGVISLLPVDKVSYYSTMPEVLTEEVIADPYEYDVNGKMELVTSVVIPITYNGKYVGVVGIDIVLETIQKKLEVIKPFEEGYVSLLSNNATVVSVKDNKNLSEDKVRIEQDENYTELKQSIIEGVPFEKINVDESNKEVYEYFTPINMGKTKTPWALGVYIPMAKVVEDSTKIRNIIIPIALASVFIILTILYIILTKLLKPIENTTAMLKDIAEGEGDLTKRLEVHTSDEIGELAKYFNLFVDKIENLVSQVKHTIDSLVESSSDIAASVESANKGIDEIAAGLGIVSVSTQNNAGVVEQTTASIHELSNSIDIISEKTVETFDVSKNVLNSSNVGIENMVEIVEANNSVNESSKEICESVLGLKNSLDKVEEIVLMITNISEQTNLLALNAAIEAARAGEHGRGFSVVAEEVRKLAEQSKESTSQIGVLLSEIKNKADVVSKEVIAGGTLSEISVEKSNGIREHFRSIFDSIKEMTESVQMITNSTNEQSKITDEMTKAMNEVSSAQQENAGSVQQINAVLEEQLSSFEGIGASMDELKKVSYKLKDMIDGFKVK